jgi:hypothetical protein
MLISAQNIVSLCAQYRQIGAIAAHYLRFILYPCGQITLVEGDSLGDDRISQLDRCLIQQQDVDGVRIQSTSHFIGELISYEIYVFCLVDSHTEIIVTLRAGIAPDLGTKEINQLHSRVVF